MQLGTLESYLQIVVQVVAIDYEIFSCRQRTLGLNPFFVLLHMLRTAYIDVRLIKEVASDVDICVNVDGSAAKRETFAI